MSDMVVTIPSTQTGEHSAAFMRRKAREAAQEFLRANAGLFREAMVHEGLSPQDLGDEFASVLRQRSPDQLEFDAWWQKYRGGVTEATPGEKQSRVHAEAAWLAGRGVKRDDQAGRVHW